MSIRLGDKIIAGLPLVGGNLPISNGGTGASTAEEALTNFGIKATTSELNKLQGMTASTAELNKLNGLKASTAELNTLKGITATTEELNKLHGLTATTTELENVKGVEDNIQTQLNGKAASEHKHSAKDIKSGTLDSDRLPLVPVAKGGTGATDKATACQNLGAAMVELGTAIPKGSNLNSYTTPGTYYSPNGETSKEIENAPYTTTGFKLEVIQTVSSNNWIQEIKVNATQPRTYRRAGSKANGWNEWYQVVAVSNGTDALTALGGISVEVSDSLKIAAGETVEVTFTKNVVAAYVTILLGEQTNGIIDGSLWTPVTSGRSHWFSGKTSSGGDAVFKTKVTIDGNKVKVTRDGDIELHYQVIAFTQ